MKKVHLNGNKYDFRFSKRLPVFVGKDGKDFRVDGYCEHAESSKYPKIRIREGLPADYELEVVLHEILHAGAFGMSEDRVTSISEQMANVLWDLGWRKLA